MDILSATYTFLLQPVLKNSNAVSEISHYSISIYSEFYAEDHIQCMLADKINKLFWTLLRSLQNLTCKQTSFSLSAQCMMVVRSQLVYLDCTLALLFLL